MQLASTPGLWLLVALVIGSTLDSPCYSLHRCAGISFQLVLPYSYYTPPHATKTGEVSLVSLPIAINLLAPEWGQCMGPAGKSIAMPKIAIYKHSNLFCFEHKVRSSRKALDVFPVVDPRPTEKPGKQNLGPRSFGPIGLHYASALLWRQMIATPLCLGMRHRSKYGPHAGILGKLSGVPLSAVIRSAPGSLRNQHPRSTIV